MRKLINIEIWKSPLSGNWYVKVLFYKWQLAKFMIVINMEGNHEIKRLPN